MCFLRGFLFLFHSLRHPVQFSARLPDLVSHLAALLAVHLRQCCVEPLAGALHNGSRRLQIALQRGGLGGGWSFCLALRFQKQLWLSKNALAHQA